MFDRKKVAFTSNNQKIVGTLFVPQVTGNLPAVVFYHGRGSRQERWDERAEALCESGFITLTFSFRGCGESEGDFTKQTTADSKNDALAAFDFLVAQEQVDRDRIGICGFSYGGYLGAIISAQRPVKSLILGAPAIHRDDWENSAYGMVPAEKIREYMTEGTLENNAAIEAIKQYKGSVLVVEHGKDEIIPQIVCKAYYENAVTSDKAYEVIKDAPHRLDGEFYEEATKITVDWFTRTLK